MAKKTKLEPQGETANTIIGIATIHRDFRLVHFVNQSLGISLSTEEDLPVYNSKTESLSKFPFFLYHHPDLRTDFCLMANQNEGVVMIPSLKQINYFLFLFGAAYKNHVDGMVTQLRKIQGVQAALVIQPSSIKELPGILEDLELHRVEIQKKIEDQKVKLNKGNVE